MPKMSQRKGKEVTEDPKERMWREAENAQIDALNKHNKGCDRIAIALCLILFFGFLLWQSLFH